MYSSVRCQLSTSTKYRPAVNRVFYDQYPAIVPRAHLNSVCIKKRDTNFDKKGASQGGRLASLGVENIPLTIPLILN